MTDSVAPERCSNCGEEVADRSEPSMDGRWTPRWVHFPGSSRYCFPEPGSPQAEVED